MRGTSDARQLHPLTEQAGQQKTVWSLAEFLVVGFCTLALMFTATGIVAFLRHKDAAGQRDFVEYWASGQQLAHHANPYNGGALLGIERTAGFPSDTPALIMGNAPPALLLVRPLGSLGSSAGELFWTLALLAALAGSVQTVRGLYGSAERWPLLFFAYSFGPALDCLLTGQMSILILLGLALFLRLHGTHPLLAGVSLWLCLLKPQLFLPFGVVLLVWIFTSRRYRILVGATAALAVSAVLVYILDPIAWTQYHQMMITVRYDRGVVPCLSNLLRRSIDGDAIWLQYVPAVLGCIWALRYYRRHRAEWDWLSHGSLLMLVSVLVAPYTWLTDQAVLIPALLHGLSVTRSKSMVAVLALISAAVQLSIFRGGTHLLHSSFVVWTAPVWLAWYLLAVRDGMPKNTPSPAMLRDCTPSPGDA
jgi:hypothetical protein